MRLFRLLAVLAAVLVLATAPAIRSAAADLATINLIQLPADNSAEVYYAQDLGYFKDAGLDVHITPMTNSGAIIAALAGGAGDIGNSAIGSAADARVKGIAVKFIAPAGLVVAARPTSLLVVPEDSPIHTAADLTGKLVAVSGLADLTYYSTRNWIDQNGGNSAAVKYIELPLPAMAAALAAHRVDAAFDIEPFLAESAGQWRELGNANGAIASRFLGTAWLASETWIDAHPDVAARFATVMRRTAIWANAHHAESGAILAKYTKIPLDVVQKMNRNEYALTLEPKMLQRPIDVAAKYGGKQAIPASELIWTVPK
jgi:NitT/TauT family transport system substrate-binding protein